MLELSQYLRTCYERNERLVYPVRYNETIALGTGVTPHASLGGKTKPVAGNTEWWTVHYVPMDSIKWDGRSHLKYVYVDMPCVKESITKTEDGLFDETRSEHRSSYLFDGYSSVKGIVSYAYRTFNSLNWRSQSAVDDWTSACTRIHMRTYNVYSTVKWVKLQCTRNCMTRNGYQHRANLFTRYTSCPDKEIGRNTVKIPLSMHDRQCRLLVTGGGKQGERRLCKKRLENRGTRALHVERLHGR